MNFQPVNAKGAAFTTVFRCCRHLLLAGIVLAASACASTTIEEAVPQSAHGPVSAAEPDGDAAQSKVASDPAAEAPNPETGSTSDSPMGQGEPFADANPAGAGRESDAIAVKRADATANANNVSAGGQMAKGRDGFPDLNVTPKPQIRQISDSEKAKAVDDLKKAQKSQKDSESKNHQDEVKRLRHLAETNAENVLREIEGR